MENDRIQGEENASYIVDRNSWFMSILICIWYVRFPKISMQTAVKCKTPLSNTDYTTLSISGPFSNLNLKKNQNLMFI